MMVFLARVFLTAFYVLCLRGCLLSLFFSCVFMFSLVYTYKKTKSVACVLFADNFVGFVSNYGLAFLLPCFFYHVLCDWFLCFLVLFFFSKANDAGLIQNLVRMTNTRLLRDDFEIMLPINQVCLFLLGVSALFLNRSLRRGCPFVIDTRYLHHDCWVFVCSCACDPRSAKRTAEKTNQKGRFFLPSMHVADRKSETW